MLKAFSVAVMVIISNMVSPGNVEAQGEIPIPYMIVGRQPSARAEALGRNFMAANGDITSTFYNPAGLALIDGINITGAKASPFYLATEAEYRYLGIGVTLGNFGSFGFSMFNFDSNSSFFFESTNKIAMYTISYARQVRSDFFIGINLDIIEEKIDIPSGTGPFDKLLRRAVYLDAGFLKYIHLGNSSEISHKIGVGASINNFTSSDIKITEKSLSVPGDELPVVLHLGVSHHLSLNKKVFIPELQTIEAAIYVEFQDFLNKDTNHGFKLGSELLLMEIFALRAGYFAEKQTPSSENKKWLTDFTYGFGFQLPIEKFKNHRYPVTLKFDFIAKGHALYTTENIFSIGDFSVYTFSLSWKL